MRMIKPMMTMLVLPLTLLADNVVVQLGEPHCIVDYGRGFELGSKNPFNGYGEVWADGEDYAAVPIYGDYSGVLEPVIIYETASASLISSIEILSEDEFLDENINYDESYDCDCGCSNRQGSRKWILVKIKKTSACKAPVTFSVGLKGLSEKRNFVIIPESWGDRELIDYENNYRIVSVDVADGCEAMGTVTEVGVVKIGKKLTIKAIANKGYAFSHWETNLLLPINGADYLKNSSFSYQVGDEINVKFIAHFILDPGGAGDDDSDSDSTLQDVYGPFVPGADVELNLGLVGYAAKKLPSGLKLNKKTGIVKGKAKKPGEYEVTFTKKGEETLVAKFIVGPMPTIIIAMEGDTEKCKVTGASKPGKGYLVGKKVSFSAKGPKGTAFTGWFKDGLPWPNETEYLEPKLKYVMTEENLSLVARFEKEKMSVACDGLSMLAVGQEVSIPVTIETQSGVKSVKGSKLPSGLKVKKDKATGEWHVTGKPKKVGSWNATIKVTAKSGAVEQLPVTVTVGE